MTEMACVEPDGTTGSGLEVDGLITGLLASGPTVAVDGDQLVLTGADGGDVRPGRRGRGGDDVRPTVDRDVDAGPSTASSRTCTGPAGSSWCRQRGDPSERLVSFPGIVVFRRTAIASTGRCGHRSRPPRSHAIQMNRRARHRWITHVLGGMPTSLPRPVTVTIEEGIAWCSRTSGGHSSSPRARIRRGSSARRGRRRPGARRQAVGGRAARRRGCRPRPVRHLERDGRRLDGDLRLVRRRMQRRRRRQLAASPSRRQLITGAVGGRERACGGADGESGWRRTTGSPPSSGISRSSSSRATAWSSGRPTPVSSCPGR